MSQTSFNSNGRYRPVTALMGMDVPGSFEVKGEIKYGEHRLEKVICYRGNFQHMLDWVSGRPKANGGNSPKRFEELLYRQDDDDFCGGSFEALLDQNPDMSDFHKSLKSLQESDFHKKISNSIAKQTTRRRARSAHDGEFDFDRKWDAEPFTRRSLVQIPNRIVKMEVSGTFSGDIAATKINEYAAFIAALTCFFERNGRMVDLSINHAVSNLSTTGHGQFFHVQVKRSDEYMTNQSIIKSISSNFYRRVGFAYDVLGCEFANAVAQKGLGTVLSMGKVFEVEDNVIKIYSVSSIDKQHEIMAEISRTIFKRTEQEN